jgi:hypothetical protein
VHDSHQARCDERREPDPALLLDVLEGRRGRRRHPGAKSRGQPEPAG